MLDAETKRRIDSCRDILVGKVPDPKSQVEQITIALIYKFMDDMDAEAEELGGQRSFFAGDYGKYGWARLMAPNLGGFEMLALYAEAIGKMNENPGIPGLFRDIFKNAYLPYRDPETLRSFLKEIDTFTYDHSERLGDAFEYLLSVLGSQGDAGQFRTPRHIIDFMVEVIDPKKNESILDPACGTAGFLISAWKHIQQQNGKTKPGDQLTPDERASLVANIRGYDISPDMVRLSLVNLYLHGFSHPNIVEYDTLTSDEKWHETADIILANPPFMSPKGGIKPHKRFSVQATRSEVLFVDYMAEHLSPQGRAAIVVPEGIIFQSGTAYKKLRELLVKTSLVAVVSLPAGVFNPYSGVKTSILILDRRLAKNCDSVLFVKVDNDGYGLGAQRRAVSGSDLPEAARLLKAFFADAAAFENGPTAHKVTRERIGENGDWGLSGERYQERDTTEQKYGLLELGTICKPEYGFTTSAEESGDTRLVRITDIDALGRLRQDGQKYITFSQESAPYLLRKGDVLVARTGATFGKTMIFAENYPAVFASYLIRLRFPQNLLLPEYYWAFAQTEKYWEQARRLSSGGGQPQFNGNALTQIKIPVPPLATQQEIVAEIESYQKIIDGARQVVENYRPHIAVQPDWPVKKLSSVCEHITDGDHQAPPKSAEGVPFVTITNIGADNRLSFAKTFFVPENYFEGLSPLKKPMRGDVLYTVTGSFGIPVLINFDSRFCFQRHIALLRPNLRIVPEFLYCLLLSQSIAQQAESAATGVAQKTVSLGSLRNFTVPVPPIETQRAIVAEIEAEQALVEANRQLIVRFEAKIKTAINRVWGDYT